MNHGCLIITSINNLKIDQSSSLSGIFKQHIQKGTPNSQKLFNIRLNILRSSAFGRINTVAWKLPKRIFDSGTRANDS